MCPIYVSNVIVECRADFLHSGRIKRVAFHNTWRRSLAEQKARATPWSDGALKNIKFQAPNLRFQCSGFSVQVSLSVFFS